MKSSDQIALLCADIECPYCLVDDPAHPIMSINNDIAIVKCVACRELFKAQHDGN